MNIGLFNSLYYKFRKGFAVVADGIIKLAEESKQSSSSIANILNEIDEGTDNASKAVDKSVEMYEELMNGSNEVISEFENIISRISQINQSVAEEQSASSDEEVKDINETIHDQQEMTQKITSASKELNAHAENLTKQIKFFKV